MYIKFDGIDPGITHADIIFHFIDLDLKPNNDPDELIESIQFFLLDTVSLAETELTEVITDADNNPNSDTISISQDTANDSIDIVFEDFGISDDSLLFLLSFKSEISGSSTWENTKGKLIASIDGRQPIPEPATLLLLGTGLVGLAGIRRKMKK